MVVPNGAIQREGEERYVYLLRDGKQEKRTVAIGTRDGGFTEIKKGLSASDKLIVNRGSNSEKKGDRP